MSGQRKDIKSSALIGCTRQICHCCDEPKCCRGVPRIGAAGNNGARPAANSRKDCDVLLVIRSPISNRLSDDSRAGLEFPELLASAGVEGLEPTFHRSIKNDVASGRERSAPNWKIF